MDWDRLHAIASRALVSAWLPRSQRALLRPIDPYLDWRQQNRLTVAARADLEAALASLRETLPRISVVMPVYRPVRIHFEAALESLRSQVLAQWQLCLCDDGSNDPDLTHLLERLAVDDPRIVVTSLQTNRGISAATNAAAALASGDVLLFMDQDDAVAPDCLAEFALAFAERPGLDMAYSDSDKINEAGEHFAPGFKPDWSPALLLSYMYLGHAVAMRREVFDRVGGLRSAFDGSQDYDLALRASEQARLVHHIPRVLYHWRCLPGSTAVSAGEKPSSISAGANAVRETLGRRGINAEAVRPDWAEQADIGLFELRFAPFAGSLSVIVFDEPGHPIQEAWLAWLLGDLPPDAQVLLATSSGAFPGPSSGGDRYTVSASVDGTSLAERLDSALSLAEGEMILMMRAGGRPTDGRWLDQLCGYAGLPGVGLAGARHLKPDGTVANAGIVFPEASGEGEFAFAGLKAGRHGAMYLARTTHECAGVSAACIALSRDVADRLERMADRLERMADTLDDCVSIGLALSDQVRTAGDSVLCCPSCEIRAVQDAASPPSPVGRLRDPWYNRNLGYKAAQFVPARRIPPLRRQGPFRIAAVTHNLDREGAQTALLDLLLGLKQTGDFDPFVISPRDGHLREAMEASGMEVTIVPSPGRRAGGLRLAEYRDRLASAFARGAADAVLANSLECHAAIAAASEAKMGSVWWQHEGGTWRSYFRHLPARARAHAYAAFAQCYRVVQVADATRVNWLPIAVQDNFEVVRHAIPPLRLKAELGRWDRASARKALGLASNECCVLLVGSLSARKGQADVVRALASLPHGAGDDLRVFLVGNMVEETYRSELAALLDRLDDRRRAQVRLIGEVDDTALYYSAADIFVCCSRQESAPRAIVEAMSFGLPVVSTPVDGIPELVRFGQSGLSFPVGDFRGLAKLLLELAASPGDRYRLGETGRKLLPLLSDYAGMIDRFGTLLREAARLGDHPMPHKDLDRRSF